MKSGIPLVKSQEFTEAGWLTKNSSRCRLKEEEGATLRSFEVEAGRRCSFGGDWRLTGSDGSMDSFRDAVGSPVSLVDASRIAAGTGLVTETVHEWGNGARTLMLRGPLGVERALRRAETVMDVSGERLGAKGARTRAVLGLGGVYRWNRWSLGGEISVSGPGSNDSEYAVGLSNRSRSGAG